MQVSSIVQEVVFRLARSRQYKQRGKSYSGSSTDTFVSSYNEPLYNESLAIRNSTILTTKVVGTLDS